MDKKVTGSIYSFCFTVLAEGMVFIDLFCKAPLNSLLKYNPIAILPFLYLLYTVLPGLLTGVFLFLAVRHKREAARKWEILSGILAIAVNVVILAAAFYHFKLEIYGHPLFFVMIGYGIVTLTYACRREHRDE